MNRKPYRLPDNLEEESVRLMHAFCSIDPDGDFDEAEWEKFFDAKASFALKQAMLEEKRVIASTLSGIHV